MKTRYLFPHKFKLLSGIVFCTTSLLLIYSLFDQSVFDDIVINRKVFAIADPGLFSESTYFGVIENNIFDELVILLFVASGLVFAFSKEKAEDEMTANIRLESLAWATYANYIVFLLCVIFIYSLAFLQVLMFAVFTHLIFFILRFNWKIYKFNHTANEE